MAGYISHSISKHLGAICLLLPMLTCAAACGAADGLGQDEGGVEVPSRSGGLLAPDAGGATVAARDASASTRPGTSNWGEDPERDPSPELSDATVEGALDDIGGRVGDDLGAEEEEVTYPPCIDNSDCPSGWCIDGYEGTVCTEFCTESCPEGWVCQGVQSPSRDMAWICQPKWLGLCRPCRQSAECPTKNSVCASYGAQGSYCATACLADDDCPDGYGCVEQSCLLLEGECACDAAASKAASSTDCWTENAIGTCTGERICTDEGLTACSALEPLPEVCDGIDNNCDGVVDEETVGLPCEISNDFGTCSGTTTCEAATAGCEGQTPSAELCDGLDNDCDGEIDEDGEDQDQDGVPDCVDDDDDNDGFPDAEDNCPGVDNPAQSDTDVDGIGDACDGDDDGDTVADEEDNCPVHPNFDQEDEDGDGVGDVCDGDQDGDQVPDDEDNCPMVPNPDQLDLDGDGLGDACSDDKDGDGTPDGADTCPDLSNPDQLDYDGDGKGDACDPDDDGDGDLDLSDCQPLDANVHHGATEHCNGIDDNCNSAIDEEGAEGCQAYFLDGDGDGFGQSDQSKCLCQPAGTFSAIKGGDCHDGAQSANPLAQEMCDGLDNNCDGTVDEAGASGCVNYFQDADFDGYGKQDTALCLCGASATHTTKQAGDCDDGNGSAYPGAQEICGGGDEDCDLVTDEVGALGCQTYYKDGDGDGWGNEAVKQCACGPSGVYVAGFGGDCDDTDENTNPDKPEICDFKDNNCNGATDEGQAVGCTTYFVDSDGDGYAAPGAQSACLCAPNPPFVAQQEGDCGGFDSAVFPGAVEVCDGKDNNCNTQIDEGSADTDSDGIADCMDSDDDNDGTPDVADCEPTNSAIPSCDGKQCGEDGCGASCGQCAAAGCTQPTAECMSKGRCQTITNAEKSVDSQWTCTGCGDIDFAGLCFTDTVVVWCENGSLTSIDCSLNGPGWQCGFSPTSQWWDCIP